MMRTRLFALVILLAILLAAVPASAQTQTALVIGSEAFDQALLDGKLTLTPAPVSFTFNAAELAAEYMRWAAAYDLTDEVDMERAAEMPEKVLDEQTLYDVIDVLSLSPDGNKLLCTLDDLLMVLDLTTQKAILPWIPAQDALPGYPLLMQNLLRMLEPNAISWSADGNHLALSFPRSTLLLMRMECNVWHVDLSTGVARALVDLPEHVRLDDIHQEGFPGIPFRAAFDAKAPVLYYELYWTSSPQNPDDPINRVFLYDPATGESTVIAEADARITSTSPIFAQEGGPVIPVAGIKPYSDMGLFLPNTEQGDRMIFALEASLTAKTFLRGAMLVDVRSNRAVMLNVALPEKMPGLLMLDLAKLAPTSFDTLYSIVQTPDASTATWMPVPTAALPDPEGNAADADAHAALVDDMQNGRILVPTNAVLSPDGSYLLVMGRLGAATACYLVRMADGTCSRVDLSAFSNTDNPALGSYAQPGNRNARGLQWVDNNRLLVFDGEQAKIFQLEIQ